MKERITKKTYTYEPDLAAEKSIVRELETGKVVFEATIYNLNNLEHHREQIKLDLGLMPGNRTKQIVLIKAHRKPTPRQFFDFDMNYYDPDEEEPRTSDDIIYAYIPEAEYRDIGFDDLYSDMLDCVIAGLDLFAADPGWSDGEYGFESFDELAETHHHPEVGESQVITDTDKVKEGFELIKQGVVEMMMGFDFDG